MKPHWYFISWDACVICGRTVETRERRYDPKPEDSRDRHEYHETACGAHFI